VKKGSKIRRPRFLRPDLLLVLDRRQRGDGTEVHSCSRHAPDPRSAAFRHDDHESTERRGGEVANLRIYIRSLRQKIELDPDQPTCILTQQGVGYRLRVPSDEL
jgi:hypothetical protein